MATEQVQLKALDEYLKKIGFRPPVEIAAADLIEGLSDFALPMDNDSDSEVASDIDEHVNQAQTVLAAVGELHAFRRSMTLQPRSNDEASEATTEDPEEPLTEKKKMLIKDDSPEQGHERQASKPAATATRLNTSRPMAQFRRHTLPMPTVKGKVADRIAKFEALAKEDSHTGAPLKATNSSARTGRKVSVDIRRFEERLAEAANDKSGGQERA